ncbi:hypothetical protein OS493_004715 [Desmophyllum pertusum]|uniref:Uncharacterized protein n=1 Tax=Desmophyllum pertusum TaxID=174260 RepID=A0A9X0CYZ6_9CNID|nr:hypothetical protein OS493_004715 [Desmophyllum pertusum]
MASCYHVDCDNIGPVTLKCFSSYRRRLTPCWLRLMTLPSYRVRGKTRGAGGYQPQTTVNCMKSWKVAFLVVGILLLGLFMAGVAFAFSSPEQARQLPGHPRSLAVSG